MTDGIDHHCGSGDASGVSPLTSDWTHLGFAFLMLACLATGLAHGGGLDASGCHNDNKHGAIIATGGHMPVTRLPLRATGESVEGAATRPGALRICASRTARGDRLRENQRLCRTAHMSRQAGACQIMRLLIALAALLASPIGWAQQG
jgi:hypothetical protein